MIEVVALERRAAVRLDRLRQFRWWVALLAREPISGSDDGMTIKDADAQAWRGTGGAQKPAGEMVDAIYQRHARAVLAYLCARLPSLTDAEDALADVFEAALGQCAEGEAPGIGWLMRVASRRVADFYRERQRRPVTPLADDSGAHPAAGPGEDPEAWALRSEERGELAALVARLPEDQREALALRFAAGLRSQEIAAVMGRSDEAIRALLSRALRRLRKEWAR